MERILVVNVKPFAFEQNITIFEGPEIIENQVVPMTIFADSVTLLARLNKVKEVKIAGPKVYTKGLQKKIEKAEFKQYNENSFTINLI